MSKLTRALVLGVTLAAVNLAGMTAAAQAQANGQPALRPPTQGQVGDSWRQRQVTAEQPNIASDARRPPTERHVGQSWRHQSDVPAQSVQPGGLSSWVIASLGLLVAVLALAGGPGTRPDHRQRARHTSHCPRRGTAAARNTAWRWRGH